jgi:hypothetical protein
VREATRPAPPTLPPPPPEAVAAFPDEIARPPDAMSEERMLKLMLADPFAAERALQTLEAPAGWQVELIAQFALTRGEKSFELDPEPLLPLPAVDGGSVSDAGPAWVAEDALPLLGAKKVTLVTLPLDTKVEVKALDGDWAEVSVAIAQQVVYGEEGNGPQRVSSRSLRGRVRRGGLAVSAADAEGLMRRALDESADEAGQLRAVALWQHAWRLERSDRTRTGLLRAAWKARRASTVVRAALARDLAAASGLRFAFACNVDDPSTSSWLDVSSARPRPLPRAVCLSGLDARVVCKDEEATATKRAAATKKWLDDARLTPKPWLRFTVDARDPAQIFLITTPLEVVDPCNDFEELTLEAGSGVVRRLRLPLGSKALVVWVPVTRHDGVEYSVPSALSETQAITWLRSREPWRWTLGKHGELEPSLGTNANSFEAKELSAASFALPPERDCSCD